MVLVVERSDRLRGSKLLQDKVMNHPKMEVLLEHGVAAFRAKDDGSGKLGTVELEDLKTGEKAERHPQGAFVFIGLDPNTGFLRGQVTELLVQARDAAREIGNDQLVQQAETRLADLDAEGR